MARVHMVAQRHRGGGPTAVSPVLSGSQGEKPESQFPPGGEQQEPQGTLLLLELSDHRPLLRPSSPRLHTGMDAYGGLHLTNTTRTTDDRACLRWGAQCLGHEETLNARPKRRTHTPMSQDSPFN